MEFILLILLLVLLFGGGVGVYRGGYGSPYGIGGILVLVLVVILIFWLLGGHLGRI